MHGFSSSSRVHIALDDRSYDIVIGTGLLDDPAAFEIARAGTQALIVTNTTVGPFYAATLRWRGSICPMASSTRPGPRST